jgi:luciferase family oxidoreductase group 1
VGTGGVLLPYYSPLKVAEQFRMLEALYPGRIDLGIGRAPGGDQVTALAMGEGRYPGAEHFPEQVQFLVAYLDGTLPADHPFAGVKVMPAGRTAPEVWLLGSSDYSGALAAQLGLRFAFAHFISADGGDGVMREYKRRYEPSQREPEPQTLLCVFVICAGTAAEAEQPRQHRSAASTWLRGECPVPTGKPGLSMPGRPPLAHHRRRVVLGDCVADSYGLQEVRPMNGGDHRHLQHPFTRSILLADDGSSRPRKAGGQVIGGIVTV